MVRRRPRLDPERPERPGAVRWFSPFAHLAAVPVGPWNAAGAAGMLTLAALLAAAGCRRHARRDPVG